MTNDSQGWFVAKGVGAFFAFLVAFLAVSAYFGGGATGIAISVVVAVAVASGLVVLWPRLRQHAESAGEKSVGHQTPLPESNLPCPPGPFDVVAGRPTKIRLKLREGDTIDGHIAEVDGYNFNWWILDEANMIRYLNKKKFDPLENDVDIPASKVNCKIPHDGPWYLLLDIYGKRITREVEVNFRLL